MLQAGTECQEREQVVLLSSTMTVTHLQPTGTFVTTKALGDFPGLVLGVSRCLRTARSSLEPVDEQDTQGSQEALPAFNSINCCSLRKRGDSGWTSAGISQWKGWSGTGMGCPESFGVPIPGAVQPGRGTQCCELVTRRGWGTAG